MVKAIVTQNGGMIMLLLLGTPAGKFNAHRVVRASRFDPDDTLFKQKIEEKRRLFQQIADEVNPILAKLGD